jgi:hypothetical protein
MKRASESRQSKPAETGVETAAGKTLPEQRDCGPSVDTWPILDGDGKPIPSKERGGAPPGS